MTRGRQREDLFRLLVESVRDYAIFLLDGDGYVRSWNAGAEGIKGYTSQEILGRHFSIFYPPEDVAQGRPEHALAVATAEGRVEDENWRLRKDGSRFWANVVITALRNAEGQVVGFAKVTRDLTERKRAEEERVQLLASEQVAQAGAEATEATLYAHDKFLAIAAHELKTPTTSLRAAGQLLFRRLDRGVTPEPAHLRWALGTMERQLDKLAGLVDRLLATLKLQEDQLSLELVRVNLVTLLEGIAEQARVRTARHDIRLDAPRAVWASLDPTRMEQVMINLIDNAIKYSPQGGPIDIAVTQPAAETVQISVRDHGLGIPFEHRPQLFERFHQAHASDHRSGMGLGLYISRRIVEQHGGQMHAEFPEGGGSRFVVSLPVDPVGPGRPGERQAP